MFTIEVRIPLDVPGDTCPEDLVVLAREELKHHGCSDCIGPSGLVGLYSDFDIRTPAGDYVLTPTLPQGSEVAALREACDKLRAALELWATGDYMRADIWTTTNAARAAHENAKGA